jgi:hypothetical protein
MNRLLFAIALSSACGDATLSRPPAEQALRTQEPHGTNLDAARELDQQGVRSFHEERYADAIRDFRAARDLGGPPSELWNIARCEERVDEGERAVQALDEYLALTDISPADRAEAEHEEKVLATRPSTLTVTTTPAGAAVTIDGQRVTRATPLSLEIARGIHTLEVRRPGYVSQIEPVEARFGRAVIVALYLVRADK